MSVKMTGFLPEPLAVKMVGDDGLEPPTYWV